MLNIKQCQYHKVYQTLCQQRLNREYYFSKQLKFEQKKQKKIQKYDSNFSQGYQSTTDKSSSSIDEYTQSQQEKEKGNFFNNSKQFSLGNNLLTKQGYYPHLYQILVDDQDYQGQDSFDQQNVLKDLLLKKIHCNNLKILQRIHLNQTQNLKDNQILQIRKFPHPKKYKKYIHPLLTKYHLKLEDLYNSTNKNAQFNFSKFNYYHSLVPKLEILSKHKNIVFQICKTTNLGGANRLLPENSVNIHLFKPFYVEEQNNIKCFVPTEAIMKHALMALYHIHDYYKYKHPKIYVNNNMTKITKLIQNWQIYDFVIICRVQSLLTYLLIQWCKKENIPQRILQKMIIQIQFSRLNPKRIDFEQLINETVQKQNIQSSQFFKFFKIQKQVSASKFIYGYNFLYKNRNISAVMLPWGLQLAEQVTKTLFIINQKIKKIGIVGGVGYTGNQQCKVDDIFIPTTFMSGNDYHYSIQNAMNSIKSQHNDTIHFTNFTVVNGCIKSVYPEIGKLSSLQVYRKVIHHIDALDMEFQAIHRVIQKQPQCSLGAIYYIMDLPRKGIHLGNTYYTKDFLEQLFSKFQRGKFYCFEKVLSFLNKEQEGKQSI